jgi:hypothetical protein
MMRTWSLLLACALVASLAACASTPVRTPERPMPEELRVAPERYVVVTVRDPRRPRGPGYNGRAPYGPSSRARQTTAAIATDYGLHETASWPITLLEVHCIVYAMPPASDPRDLLARLTADRRVESAQPLATFATQGALTYNDPYARLQSSLDLLGVAEAQQWSRGAGVRVAIVDTGLDAEHPDLRGRVVAQRNFVDADAAAFARDVHGTAIAGVIAAIANNGIGIAGIAPDVRVLAYKACWADAARRDSAVCNSFTLAQAIAAAIAARADVVNLSLAGPSDPLLTRIVREGQRKGTVFVGAAPPDGTARGFPGDVPGVLMVDAPGRRRGTPAALVAPGLDVLTLAPGAHYDFASGSSLAAAQTSAVVALMLEANDKLRGDELAQLLKRTSHAVSSPNGRFVAINACAALVAVRGEGRCRGPAEAGLAHERRHAPAE